VQSSVDFNDQKFLAANEVTDVAAYRDLSDELVTVKLAIADTIP